MSDKRAVIFCSASYDIDPSYNQAAREVVRAVCLAGYEVVSGGTVKGTMGVVSKAVEEFGGTHRGILPRFMEQYRYPGLDELVWTDTMAQRKEAMREGTSVAIALPGGIGTMEELMETLTLAKLHKYSGKVMAFNYRGFYDHLKGLLDHLVETRMLAECDRALISFPESIEEIKACL
ncbi:MAG: TIGR00730 family Rossman fold protein [Bacteroidales bacterium]|nr:TIGR00730 family Rossman fold protein [Bacteroidales bacterium]